ncbi:hypothetical protein B484DRAFT_391418, partial [Ochromonadaceae sp. CCMP2298]
MFPCSPFHRLFFNASQAVGQVYMRLFLNNSQVDVPAPVALVPTVSQITHIYVGLGSAVLVLHLGCYGDTDCQ